MKDHDVELRLPRDRRQAMIASWAELAFGRQEVRDQDLTHEMVMVHVADATNAPNVEDEEEDRP